MKRFVVFMLRGEGWRGLKWGFIEMRECENVEKANSRT
jgi:hypothetical protein